MFGGSGTLPPGCVRPILARHRLDANSRAAPRRRNRPEARQQRLKSLPRVARARIVAAELLEQLDRAALDRPPPALDARLARIALTPLAGPLESRGARRDRCAVPWS